MPHGKEEKSTELRQILVAEETKALEHIAEGARKY